VAAPLALAALAAFGLAGCSSGASNSTPLPSPRASTTAPAATPPPPADAAARAALRHALTETGKVRSYSFRARTTVQAKQVAHSTITGRVVRGNGVAYRLRIGKKTTQVVRIHRATYVRKVPGRWSRLKHPRSVVNPGATLSAVLRGITPTGVTQSGHGRVIRGALSAHAAGKAGLPHDRDLARVVVRLDRHYRVVDLMVHTRTAAGSHTVGVVVHSSYAGFGKARRIHRPV
jgi:hypothetical protein